MLESGTRLGSYEIVASLGQGGMGIVYRAKDLKLGREVAVKVLCKEFASDQERLRRFEQEARSASALNHPNIVHIYDIGDDDGIHYMAMELVEGETLRQMLGRPLAIPRLLEIGTQISEGLAKAHEAGIVHRDVKPENIVVSYDGFVKILDFGLAKLTVLPFEVHSEMVTMLREGTRAGMLLGTVEYMSPEQAAGRSVDPRSDQFSLGLILYEMATGRIAFQKETAPQTLASIIESDPKPVASVNAECPDELARVIQRCLAKRPEDRFDSTRELVKALKAVPPERPRGMPAVPPPGEPVATLPPVPLPVTSRRATYYVQTDDAVKQLSEGRLRRRLRKNEYSGVELVRREGETDWQPLYESQIFKEEVPYQGDPYDWARRRKIQGFLSHGCVFVTVGGAMWFASGQFPFWLMFWGMGLGFHFIGTLPYLFGGRRPRRVGRGATSGARRPLGQNARDVVAAMDGKTAELLSPELRDEIERVKDLLGRKRGDASAELIEEVDRIVERIEDLTQKRNDLEEQTSDAVLEDVSRSEREAQANAETAESARDRKLFQRQLAVLIQRRQAIEKARQVLARLRVREEVAEHQIKQLRLDLSRGEASATPVPELTSRLQDIRLEVDAAQDVDDAIAQEFLS